MLPSDDARTAGGQRSQKVYVDRRKMGVGNDGQDRLWRAIFLHKRVIISVPNEALDVPGQPDRPVWPLALRADIEIPFLGLRRGLSAGTRKAKKSLSFGSPRSWTNTGDPWIAP